ncbi:MAG: alpha-galactosidase, partial [Anaerolineae bacterium]|nr:alpha-galactosidase [Anaerolineae bacterium]
VFRIPGNEAVPAFSFRYDCRPSRELLPRWKRRESSQAAPGGRLRHVAHSDPATGLRVTAHVREFDRFPAQEWMLELENTGAADTPIIEDILPLALELPLPRESKFLLHHAKGSPCEPDDFMPRTDEIRPKRSMALASRGGFPSGTDLPFMNLQWPGGGLTLAIGWSGQWSARFERSQDALSISAGMERTHLRLHPREKVRTPRILLISWEGEDPCVGHNLLRRLILEHCSPRIGGSLIMPPIAHNTMSYFYRTKLVSEEGELDLIARTAALGMEAYWLDACWYGEGGEGFVWWQQVGDWRVRPDVFPRGLKPLGDAAHRAGLKFVLWFEPERVRREAPIAREHPEYLLQAPEDPDNLLLNLGLPEARAYVTDAMSEVIAASGVDIYRQDCNFASLLPYWRAADADDRIGMAEIRHIEGLYAMWDDLLARHPGLAIDNCASGGRRIDLETMSRSFPLWRSDFSDFGGPSWGPTLQIADQVQTSGLSRWVPFHTGPVWTFSPYDFRSAIGAGIVPYCDLRAADFDLPAARAAIAELKALRPYFLGDFYPLLPLSAGAHDWCAYQYDRPDLGAGFGLFLRRHQSPFPTMEVALSAIDPAAEYEVTLAESFAGPAPIRMPGEKLLHLSITISQVPGSILLRYRRTPAP